MHAELVSTCSGYDCSTLVNTQTDSYWLVKSQPSEKKNRTLL